MKIKDEMSDAHILASELQKVLNDGIEITIKTIEGQLILDSNIRKKLHEFIILKHIVEMMGKGKGVRFEMNKDLIN